MKEKGVDLRDLVEVERTGHADGLDSLRPIT